MAFSFAIGDGLNLVFPTPILQLRDQVTPALNDALATEILNRSKRGKGVTRSNVGGWHSEDDLFTWQHPGVRALQAGIGEGLKRLTSLTAGNGGNVSGDFSAVAWANVNHAGDFNRQHNHPGFVWSGVYYVRSGRGAGDASDGGMLELFDPRLGADMVAVPGDPFGGTIPIAPEDRMMVIFPSWLQHWVTPYKGEGPRISIAFNVAVHNVVSQPARR